MNMRKLMVLLLIIVNVLWLNGILSFSQEIKKNHILVLNSYHQGYAWTDHIITGIEKVLDDENNVIRIEYMDTKIIKDDRHLNNLYELYKHKFSDHKFDVIIASDNDAYNFLKKYHKSLFKDTPIICCGLNIFDDFITNGNNMFTGITETVNIKDTIDLAYKLHPDIKNVVILVDESLFGDMNIETVKKISPLYKGKLKFHFIQSDSIEEILENIKKIPRDSMIFKSGLYKDKVGEPISIEEGTKMISKAVNVPLYSCWEMNLGHGVIGGKVVSGYSQGETAAKMALKILEGQNIKDIPFIEQSINKYVFDYALIGKYNIKPVDLPEGSIFINNPSPFLKIKRSIIYLVIMLIVALLAFFNFILYKNILKLRKAEKELKKEKKILQSILDSTLDGILVLDEDKHIVNYNNGFKKMWRVTEKILDENNNNELIDYVKEQLVDPDKFVKRAEEITKSPSNTIDIIEFKDQRVFERTHQPLVIEGRTSGILLSFKDITKKRALEELKKEIEIKERLLEEANKYSKMKAQFFATISHELKTPLNIILGIVQLIDITFCKEKNCVYHNNLNKYVKISRQNCYRLLKLINNLIDITKIDSGYMHMKFKNYNIVNIVEDITLSVAEYVESKGINLIFDTEIEEKIIACDAEKLERVMLNLFSNAVKFTESKGTIKVHIHDKGESILICVKDTGSGIPQDMKEKIFDRFRQVDASLHRKAEGSGIGLSLVKSIVELHKGSITVESEVGKGSTFIIELPSTLVGEELDIYEEVAATNQPNVERISIEFSDIYS